jgi:CHAD domain-containing protein
LLLGTHFEKIHAAVKGYQEVLGTMHDLDVFAGIVRGGSFPPEEEKVVLAAIAAQRAKLFNDFTVLLETMPFEAIGQQVRNGL